MILADDVSWCDGGCYGNPDVRTPSIDRLAGQGMLFTRAFTATAMCAPSRQQLYTGVFPVRNGAYPNKTEAKPGTRSMAHHLRALGYRVGVWGKRHYGPPESFPFDLVASGAEYISKAGPFCMVYASKKPHSPWPEPDGYDPQTVTLPPFLVDNGETRRGLCSYYTEVSEFDHEVGEVLNALAQSGKEDDTVVIVTSEQGASFPGGKWTCYDYGLQVQFIVRWPGKVKPGAESDAMIQYVDVVPTLVELAGGGPASIDTGLPGARDGGSGFDGESFLGALLGKADKHNRAVFGVQTTQGIGNGKPYPVRSIRDEHYKYILNLMPDATFQNNVTENDRENFWRSWVRDSAVDQHAAKLVKRYRQRSAEEL